jgi:hypothetical protein
MTRAVLKSLVPVICPPEAHAFADPIVDHVGLSLGATSRPIQLAFQAGVRAYDLGALPRFLRRARALRGDRAEQYYASWEHSPVLAMRTLARTFNQLVSLACYELPAMMDKIGYHPAAWIAEVKRKRLALYKVDIDAHARAILAPDPLRPALARKVAHGRR